MVIGVLCHVLTTFGGGLVANGTLSDSDSQSAIYSIITLVGIGWSIFEKVQARKAAAQKAGKPESPAIPSSRDDPLL